MHGLVMQRHEKPDRTAQAAAMVIMTRAFDPVFGEAWTAPQLGGMMALPGTWLTLARLDAATLGFALVRSVLDESELLLLAVDPGWSGRSIGTALLRDCLTLARFRGILTMHLEVRSTNDAIHLYKNVGFNHISTRPNYYRGSDGQFHDALTYRLDL